MPVKDAGDSVEHQHTGPFDLIERMREYSPIHRHKDRTFSAKDCPMAKDAVAAEGMDRMFDQLPLPFGDLVGVQLKLFGQLCQGLVLAQSGKGHARLECRRVGAAGAAR